MLGVVIATVIIIPFTSLPNDDIAEQIEEITEVLIFTIFILQPIPYILKRYINRTNNNDLIRPMYILRNIHIALGILFIGLRILHIEVNVLFESIEWNMETITSILLSIILIPTITYGVLRINNSEKYRKQHRLYLLLTYFMFIIHLLS